ncbi:MULTISPECIES: hypothetical protein [Brevibacillus]|uniref:hypothetical protein n=1 Tax=Brevibacillus TaxID=55080 RepID=UPI000D0EC047|nr:MULTISPECIES: hypothetical protein [Brevibacillus]PSJ68668.1 hypothetical protein C7J99_15740 [Brevibacillus brevis]RED34027.1 hypothetical protein DES34_102192 [Brevibacillus brevis]TQK62750.1 hypothetical protein FB479_10463 [Brevibacillus sp. AG162]VEF92403.1 Uncharacterised protein [Brevibacillus brevis]GEC92994.1 hypothetical protein BBR01nite_53250 [Brevibacillus brevis]
MRKRIGVHFRKTRKTTHTYERIQACTRCHTYHVLWETHCETCGRAYTPIRQVSHAVTRRYVQTRFLLLGLFVCLAVLSAETLLQLALAGGIGCVLFVLFFVMQKKYGIYERDVQFQHFLTKEQDTLKKSLLRHLEEVGNDVKEGHLKEAYEKTREIGHFIDSDTIKIRKIMFLNHYVLRKDMELELETLIPSMYDKDFMEYVREVIKVQPSLVKKSVLTYVRRYKNQILLLENGDQLIGQVAGAALRMKSYVDEYQDLIIEFIDFLPRERLLRLAKMVQTHKNEGWEQLYHSTKNRVDTHYAFDPDFKGIL